MDCRLNDKIRAMVEDLAREHQRELAAAGTLVDLEELTCEIGDEVARQLCEHELVGRAERALDEEFADCPDCGESSMQCVPEPTLLTGLRGDLAYNQPRYYCPRCRRSFFPMAASLGLPARSNVTPRVLRKMVWAGSNLGSFVAAEDAMRELAEVSTSSQCIRRVVQRIGGQRVDERAEAVERFKQMDLPKQQAGSKAATPPEIGVISMDGGRYQRRDHFGDKDRPSDTNHWKEDKVGCLLSMRGPLHENDPAPDFPEWLASSSAVAELAKMTGKTGGYELSRDSSQQDSAPGEAFGYKRPELVSREVIASGDHAESFGWQLATAAWQHGFPAAERLAFVADGAHVNWTIQRKHFSHAVPILDLMHALSYAHSAAEVVEGETPYPRWAAWIWSGKVARVIEELRIVQERIGPPPPEPSASDPRQRIRRAITYYENHRWKMNYPEYRRLGLPLTSSHIESTIKQIAARVKGSEKFWSRPIAEAILQLRSDHLSDSKPLKTFWLRQQARQTGTNTYRHAT